MSRDKIPKYRRRTRIAQHAQVVYRWSGKPYTCLACGYTLHVNICHVKDIKDFDDDALMSEINHPDNLISLCPTHHWEFDHGHWHLPTDSEKGVTPNDPIRDSKDFHRGAKL